MPSKRKSKNASKKYKRAKYPSLPKAVVCYCPQVAPDVMKVQLKYTARKNATSGTLNVDDYVFRGNGLFDPDFAAGGQQPMGFDQWAAFYKRYRVTACKVTVQGQADAAETSGIGISALTTSSALINLDQLHEAQYNKHLVIGQDGAQGGRNKLSMYMPTAIIRGGPHDIVQYDDQLSSLTSTNPGQEWFFHVYGFGQGVNFASNMTIELVYYVEFYDRTTLTRS